MNFTHPSRVVSLLLALALQAPAFPALAMQSVSPEGRAPALEPAPAVEFSVSASGDSTQVSVRANGRLDAYAAWATSDVGGYDMPARRLVFEITTPGPLQMRVDGLDSVPFTASLPLAPRSALPGVPFPGQEIEPAPEVAPVLPAAPAFVLAEGLARGTRLATVVIAPVFEQAGQPRIITRLNVRVAGARYLGDSANRDPSGRPRFPAATDVATGGTGGGLGRATGAAAALTCANTLPLPHAPLTDAVANVPLRDKLWRITVTQEGIQSLTASALQAAGVLVASTPTADYQVWRDGVRLASHAVDGNSNDRIDNSDELRFYATRPGDAWNNGQANYWLSIGDGTRLAMTDGTQALAGVAQTTAVESGVWRENVLYLTNYPGPLVDGWYARKLITGVNGAVGSVTFPIGNLLPAATGAVTLTVQGVKRGWDLQYLQAAVNGTQSPEVVSGFGFDTRGNWVPTLVVPNNGTGSSATLAIHPNGAVAEVLVQQIDWQRSVNLNFSSSGGFATLPGAQRYALSVPAGAQLYEVNDPTHPRTVSMSSANFQSPGGAKYYLLRTDSLRQPSLTKYSGFVDLASPRNGDAVYIAPGNLQAALGPLVTHRMNQGWHTQVIDLQRIYDWWSDGDISPEAIRGFLRYANATWPVKPQGITLAGDSTFDPFNNIKQDWDGQDYAYPNILPAYLANVDQTLGVTACDTCYVRYDCDNVLEDQLPDAWVGRLSVNDSLQLATIVSKTVGYETSPDEGAWRNTSTFFSDKNETNLSFENTSESMVVQQPGGINVNRRYYLGSTPGSYVGDPTSFTNQALSLINSGSGVVTYNGHGNFPQWAGAPLLMYWNQLFGLNNTAQLPFVMEFTCATALFIQPTDGAYSVDEVFQRMPGGAGAMGVWGSAGWDKVEWHERLATGFYDRLWDPATPARSQPLGALIESGYENAATYGNSGSIYTYLLLGDPLTRLRVNPARALPASLYMGTIAGHSDGSSGSADGYNTGAAFSGPSYVAVSNDGMFAVVADSNNHTLRRIELPTRAVSTLAGLAGNPGSANGQGSAARLSSPSGVAITPDGKVAYVADTGNQAIRRVDIAPGAPHTVTTLALGPAFVAPSGLAMEADGLALYVTDTSLHMVKRVLLATGEVQTVAGISGSSGADNGAGTAARFNQPDGIAVSADDTFALISDRGNHTVRRIDLTTAAFTVTLQAGAVGTPGNTNGAFATARFNGPRGIALAPDGRMAYVADTGNQIVRRIDLRGGTVATVLGSSGQAGHHDGHGSEVRFSQPIGIGINPAENRLVIGDALNNRIRSSNGFNLALGVRLPSIAGAP